MKMEKFWLVLKPESKNELGDILYSVDIERFAIRGGLKKSDIIGAYTSKDEAKEVAAALLKLAQLIGAFK